MGNVPAGLSVSKHNQSTGYKWSKCDWEPFQVIVNIKLKISLSDLFHVTPCHHFEIIKWSTVQKGNLMPLREMEPTCALGGITSAGVCYVSS